MDSKTNFPSLLKRVPKGNSVLDEINRGKEYYKLLEQRQSAVKSSLIVVTPKTIPDGQVTVQTKPDPIVQIAVQTKPDPLRQIAVQAKLDPVIQDDNAKSVQIDQNIKTTSEVAAEIVDTKPLELYQQLYPDVYVERIIVPEYQPNYDEIPRATRSIINRDTLSLQQHMNLLAQPKIVRQRRVEPPYIVRRKVPGPSPRIIQLARPKRRQTLETCNRFGATMEKSCIENCHRNVQDVTFVPVHDAVYFIELNKRRPLIEKEKLKLRMKRLQDKINEAKMAKTQDVLRTLYSSLKGYLLPPPPLPTKKPAKCAECAKGSGPCANCTNYTDDQQVYGDDETRKLSLVLRCKMEKLLNRKDKIEQGSHWDLLLSRVSGKLAIWMKKLENSEVIEKEPEVTTEV